MPANVQLDTKKILDKEFKTSMKGYNKEEVDQFLDYIIQDYELFQEHIHKLEREVEQLSKMTASGASQRTQRSSVSEAQAETVASETPNATGTTNYDILKRLSNLEKEVFGKKLSE